MTRAAARRVHSGLVRRIDGGVAWLRLDRPRDGNRVTLAMAQALCDAAAEIEDDDGIVAVVLAAAGKTFCLGLAGDAQRGDWERRVDWIGAIGRLTRPVVAAVQGNATAEGLELALACDLRLVSTRAELAMPQLRQGRVPSHGGTQRLPRLVGRMRALDLLLTGRAVAAGEAATIGLASRVATPAAFAATLAELVDSLRAKGPLALRYAKEAVLNADDLTLDQGMRLEEDLYVLLQTTQDRREGIDAFLKKRAPQFIGR